MIQKYNKHVIKPLVLIIIKVILNGTERMLNITDASPGTYQSLRRSDVGQMSTYSAFNHHGNQPSEPAYANTVIQTGNML